MDTRNPQYKLPIVLKHQKTGKYLGHFYNGTVNYFPALRENDAVKFAIFFADDPSESGSINSNSKVCIKCLEDGMNSQNEVWLGAFSDTKYVCYYSLDAKKTEWIIQKSQGTGDIQYGDTVKLINVHYEKEYGFYPTETENPDKEPYILLHQTKDLLQDDMYFIVTKSF